MRIVSGTLGGRSLHTPNTDKTRPMTDKVRAAVFNILGDIEGLTVLDAYAGSGALGFEAISRGAQSATAIEMGRQAIEAIEVNIKTFDLDFQYRLERRSVESWLARHPTDHFDLIFAMPPYAILDKDIIAKLGRLLNKDGLLIVEYPRQTSDFEIEGYNLVEQRTYGDPHLVFYRRSA